MNTATAWCGTCKEIKTHVDCQCIGCGSYNGNAKPEPDYKKEEETSKPINPNKQ